MENQAKHQHGHVYSIYKEDEAVEIIELPHSDELERCVLGALITDTLALYATIDSLHKELFYSLAHQVLFETIHKLFNDSQAVDILTVVNELRKEGKLEQAGGVEYVSRIATNVVSAAHIHTHIAILAEKHIYREIIRTTTKLLKDASNETRDPIELLEKSVWSLETILESFSHDNPMSLNSVLCALYKDIQSAWEQEVHGIPSGYSYFDAITHGFQPGTLIVLASKPAMGKTSCALSMARNMAFDFCFPVAFFSLQMKGTGLVSRLLSQEMGIPQSHLKNASIITTEKKQLIIEKIKELQEIPLFIDDADIINFTQLQCSCKRLVYKHNIRMIFIDGLPQIYASAETNPNRNRTKELCFISHKIKSLAQELNVPILITTSFDHEAGDIPTLSDLQESGCIDEVADIVISIHRKEQDERSKSPEGKASLQILKNKEGELGVVDIRFNKNSMKFYDPNTSPSKNI